MKTFVSCAARLTLLAALLQAGTARAISAIDDPVASVQGALKKQGFYQGEPTGQLDAHTHAALKRFQIRHGLEVTGEIDSRTLQALKSGGRSPAEVALEPTIRERARDVVRSDKEFLEKVEVLNQADAPRPPVPRTSPAPDAPPAPVIRRAPPAPEPPSPVAESALLPGEKVQRFIQEYLRASQGDTPEDEVALYADEVDYFDSGRVSRKVVEKDQRAYYRRWPSRKFTLLGEPQIERVSGRAATVRFRMRYALRSGDESASGKTENVLRVKQTESGLKIAAIRERKVTE